MKLIDPIKVINYCERQISCDSRCKYYHSLCIDKYMDFQMFIISDVARNKIEEWGIIDFTWIKL